MRNKFLPARQNNPARAPAEIRSPSTEQSVAHGPEQQAGPRSKQTAAALDEMHSTGRPPTSVHRHRPDGQRSLRRPQDNRISERSSSRNTVDGHERDRGPRPKNMVTQPPSSVVDHTDIRPFQTKISWQLTPGVEKPARARRSRPGLCRGRPGGAGNWPNALRRAAKGNQKVRCWRSPKAMSSRGVHPGDADRRGPCSENRPAMCQSNFNANVKAMVHVSSQEPIRRNSWKSTRRQPDGPDDPAERRHGPTAETTAAVHYGLRGNRDPFNQAIARFQLSGQIGARPASKIVQARAALTSASWAGKIGTTLTPTGGCGPAFFGGIISLA